MNIQTDLLDTSKNDALRQYVETIAKDIAESNAPMPLKKSKEYPKGAGVYCIFRDGTPIYVGESGDLPARMKDLFRTVNHSFRRSLGTYLYAQRSNFVEASSSKKFPSELEDDLTKYMESELTVVVTPIVLGRKEVEEVIYKNYQPQFNVRGQRGD
ncbi:GIY-YIG nuclease family protein [Undibacterium sp. CY21W]|uniref:GIY-YIG nuclease family protein n=1 Tax=Undibacterium sp. CY21W TaxID=2762293 RepID=UPI00164C9F6F|nr:hypothetical protein [Undibacterium sp. CY21W]MBC3926697.1 hypothetical protein [Undibacterium sp. CY21W]